MKNNQVFLGKSGIYYLMSEFIIRGWNAAASDTDVANQTFTVQNETGALRKVQCKTSAAAVKNKRFSAKFKLSLKQLQNISNVRLYYAFTVRHLNQWTKPLIIRQDHLLDHLENDKIGSVGGDHLTLNFNYSDGRIECSKINLIKYIDDFSEFS